jgi:hypothetical protein
LTEETEMPETFTNGGTERPEDERRRQISSSARAVVRDAGCKPASE